VRLDTLALPHGTPWIDTAGEVELGGTVGKVSTGTLGRVGEISDSVGPGTTTIGLVPELPISVEPSGIPARLEDAPIADDMSEGELPDDEPPVAIEPQPPDNVEGMGLDAADMAVPIPPPSKGEVEDPEADMPTDPAIPTLDIPAPEHDALPSEPSGAGLRPPGLSSTAPIGMPTGPTGAPDVPAPPRGEVIPMAGKAEVSTCARLGPPEKKVAVVMAISKHVAPRLYCFRIGAHHRFRRSGPASKRRLEGASRSAMRHSSVRRPSTRHSTFYVEVRG
jgi:hypothetical protein